MGELSSGAAVAFSMSPADYARLTGLSRAKVPFVLPNRPAEENCNSITLDDFSAGFKAARLLCELGHRRIGYIPGSWCGTATRERMVGFRAALETYGCYDPELFSPPTNGDYIDPVRRHVKKLLAMDNPATALATFNDAAAVTALVAVREAGLRVPEDFSVIGFDNSPEFIDANLTTFDYRYRDIAEHAVHMLDGLIRGKIKGPARVSLMPRFIEGGTTARRRAPPVARLHEVQ